MFYSKQWSWIPIKFWLLMGFFVLGLVFTLVRVVWLLVSDDLNHGTHRFLLPKVEYQTPLRRSEIGDRYNDEDTSSSFLSSSAKKPEYKWLALPDTPPIPENNPMTEEKVALGKMLFNETLLSVDNSISCATCHELNYQYAGTDKRKTAIGVDHQMGSRNTPTIINSAFQRLLFWDGRANSLEEQALGPIVNPLEMGAPNIDFVLTKLKSTSKYEKQFALAFPANPDITSENLAKALAAFERTLVENNTPYDRFIRGDRDALSEKQIRGMALFEEFRCVVCHSGPNFSDASYFSHSGGFRLFPVFNNTEFETEYQLTNDLGKLNSELSMTLGKGVFRIPSLRNVSRTAPYFHNGSVDTLEEAVRLMANVQLGKIVSNDESADKRVKWFSGSKTLVTHTNLAISDREVAEIVAFLEALSE